MPIQVYDVSKVYTIDGKELEVSPLKIKYLKEFMVAFYELKRSENEDSSLDALLECIKIAMKQYCPEFQTKEDIEDNFDLPTIYSILDIAAGIKKKSKEEVVEVKEENKEGMSWENLDLAKLESEVFFIGVWKNFEELEESLSLVELFSLLESKRDLDYTEKKFFAALQGVDLDKETGKSDGVNAWEKMKAKVFSGGQTSDPNDITSYQGAKAQKAGFGVGMGISYERIDKK